METTLVVRARTPTLTQLEEVLIDLDLPVGRTVTSHDFLRRFVPAHEPPARPGAGEPAHWRIRTPRELRHAPAVDGRQLLEEFRVGCPRADVALHALWRRPADLYAPTVVTRFDTRAQERATQTSTYGRTCARTRARTYVLLGHAHAHGPTRARFLDHAHHTLLRERDPGPPARSLEPEPWGGGSESESETRIEWAAPTIRATVWWDSAAAWPAPTA